MIVALTLGAGLFFRSYLHSSPFGSYSSKEPHIWAIPLDWADTNLPASPKADKKRPVFLYSVIPGGVGSSDELLTALRRDPVAAAHYRDFRAESARVMRLANARQAYVSYRLGNHVYWTSKKVTLAAGETVLTDGMHMARTRCGNRISEVPGPSSPVEPPKEALNTPVSWPLTDGPLYAPPGDPLWADGASPFPLARNGPPITGGPGNGPFVPSIPLGPCCSAPGGSSGSSPKTPPLGTSPVSTPEPQSLLLLVIGLSVLFAASLFRRA